MKHWLKVGVFVVFSLMATLLLAEQYLLEIPLPQKDGSVLGEFLAQKGKVYKFILAVDNIPANLHGWKAKLSLALKNEKTGKVINFTGSPKKYLYRRTNGGGRSYFTYLTFYVLRPEETSKYSLQLLKSSISLPSYVKIRFLVIERGEKKINANLILWIILTVVVLLFLFFRFRNRYEEEEEDY
jgi:hypothetical protein